MKKGAALSEEERVRRAVACAEPGDPIVDVKDYSPIFVVELASGWIRQVQLPRDDGDNADRDSYRRHGFEIILVVPHSTALLLHRGVALFDDGHAYCLSDAEELVRFYRRTSAAFGPIELAQLLATYQSDVSSFVIDELTRTVGRLVLERPLTSIPGFTLPRVQDGVLRFWSVVFSPHLGAPELLLCTSWTVRGLEGDLSWEKQEFPPIHCRVGSASRD